MASNYTKYQQQNNTLQNNIASESSSVADYILQGAGSYFDAVFAAAKNMNISNVAQEGVELGGNAFSGMFFGAGVILGAAEEGIYGAVKGAFSGASAIEGAELGAAGGAVAAPFLGPAAPLGPPVGAVLVGAAFGLGVSKLFDAAAEAVQPPNNLPDPFAGFTAPGTVPVSGNFPNFDSLPYALGDGTLGSSNPSPYGTLNLSGSQPNPSYQQPIFSTLGDGTNIGSYTPPSTGVTAPGNLGLGSPSPLPGSAIMPNQPLNPSAPGSSGMSSPSLTDPNYGFAPSTGVTAPNSLGTGAPSLLPGSDIMPNLPVNFDPNSNVPGVFNISDAGANAAPADQFLADAGSTTQLQGAGAGTSANGFSLNPGVLASPGAFGVAMPTGGGAASPGVYAGGGYVTGGLPGGGYVTAGLGGGGGSYAPVVLDLSGKGIKVTPLSSSNMFFDTASNGKAQRTAWAGAGNGVLVYDPSGGAITSASQFEFTLWDPAAKNDMQALAAVFDTNHDGVLNSSDASWSNFRILVTNANGTTTLETLAQAGVTSINLTTNAYQQTLPDGSSIDGETTFTRTNGTTGTAAALNFANDGGAYNVQQTVTTNADGSTTLQNSAYNSDGTLAERITTTTSANRPSKTAPRRILGWTPLGASKPHRPAACFDRRVPGKTDARARQQAKPLARCRKKGEKWAIECCAGNIPAVSK